ncbi:UNVERIFIED_CONTAM: BMT2 family SAM-dependent methyltransferase, partial [Bacteroidetes bacterium 56_B9]
FDIVSCSLVLNFVDDPHQRGRMLRLIHAHLRPLPSSLVFLVLPLPCVNNSRYLDRERLIAIMRAVGFKMEKERWKPDNKVGYWLWSWQAPV